jgi:outer membrane lipoprotein-sorting protein
MNRTTALLAIGLWAASMPPALAQITGSVPLPPTKSATAVKPAPVLKRTAQATAPRPPGEVAAKPAALGKRGETMALDAEQRALVDRVSAALSTVRTLVGNFVQVGPDGKRITGDLYLQKPGKIRFEYDAPSPIEIVADGQSLVVRDRKLATQDLYPLSQTPLRFLLADRIDLARDTNLIGVHADDVYVTVVIEERSGIVGTNRLMLMFNAKDLQLRQWTVTDPQGYDTTVAVYNLDTTKRPDPGMFKINYERVLQ